MELITEKSPLDLEMTGSLVTFMKEISGYERKEGDFCKLKEWEVRKEKSSYVSPSKSLSLK